MNWTRLFIDDYWVVVLLFALTPLLTGYVAYRLAMLRRVVANFHPGNLAASYVGAITLPFALFLAFMVSDIWARENRYAQTVLQEVQRIDAMLDAAAVCGAPCNAIDDAVGAYARALSQYEWDKGWTYPNDQVTRVFETLVAQLAESNDQATIAPHLRSALLTSETELRRLRTERYFILHADLAPHRWVVVVLLGLLAQISLAALHVGRRPQLVLALGIFSAAFAVTLAYTVALAWPTVDEGIIPSEQLTRILAP